MIVEKFRALQITDTVTYWWYVKPIRNLISEFRAARFPQYGYSYAWDISDSQKHLVGQHIFSYGQLHINWPQYVVLGSTLWILSHHFFFQIVIWAVFCSQSGQHGTSLNSHGWFFSLQVLRILALATRDRLSLTEMWPTGEKTQKNVTLAPVRWVISWKKTR